MDGKVAAEHTYDTWGKPLTTNITDSKLTGQPIRYASYYYDEDLALYYLMARYYHPEQAVFLSIDPELDADETVSMANGYSYADNNPVLKVDPDGTWAWAAIGAGYGAYTGYKAAKAKGKKGWKLAGYSALGAASGAIGIGKGYKVGKKLYTSYSKYKKAKPKKGIFGKNTVGAAEKYVPRNIKMASTSHLKRKGIDAHKLKTDFVGKKNIAHYDLYVDKKTGMLWIYRKGGKGEGMPTYEYIK